MDNIIEQFVAFCMIVVAGLSIFLFLATVAFAVVASSIGL